MYIPPILRNTLNKDIPTIENLCDEFLHIDDTPEANVCHCCSENNTCVRKSVTCVVILKKDEDEIYSKVYKNKSFQDAPAIHAEIFVISDQELKSKLDYNQSLCMYLTFQPCHYSGGHNRVKKGSCTESIQRYYLNVLKPFNISLHIKFAYLYRAHWIDIDPKYTIMIENAKKGLKILSSFAKISVIDSDDINILKKFCNHDTQKKLNSGHYDTLILNRSKIVRFIENFLQTISRDKCMPCN
tara:strand:+ start:629 stop:1354 length:726 start_codon:yes stop_codon:yes gene_type:complete